MTTRIPLLLACSGFLLAAPLAARGAGEAENVPYPHGEFAEDCALCHSAERWLPAQVGKDFKHAAYGFRLEGAHRTTACRACHATLDFGSAPTACVDCHRDVHRGELGTDCSRCHTPNNFIDRTRQLAAHRATRFPLTGSHLTLDCEACHTPQPQGHMVFVNTPAACEACHLDDYQATTSPDHAAAGFPTDCARCHTTTDWSRARFDHSGTAFPLTGAHRSLPCASCHPGNQFPGAPTDCYACHRADYEGADPDHVANGFPTDCTLCHDTRSFGNGSFAQHDALYFPIYSGSHRGRWSACGDCHTNPASFSQFSCFLCHEQGETDAHHQEVGGYSYDSQACYGCHPTGRAED